MLEEVASVLLQKGSPFVLYRLPGAKKRCLAVGEEWINFSDGSRFVIAPFSADATNRKIVLHKMRESVDENTLLRAANALPDFGLKLKEVAAETSMDSYLRGFQLLMERIHSKQISKAVLSRVMLYKKPSRFSPIEFFDRLSEVYPAAFVHLFYHPLAGLWAGATPELLLQREGNSVITMALAGTQKQTNDAYFWGEKEQEEHRILYDHIEPIFAKHGCGLLKKSAPYSVEAGAVAHLRTDFEFSCGADTQFEQLVADYHPTPAVAGWPVPASVEAITAAEAHSRSYYSGYLGEISENSAALFVDLRCVQIGETNLAIFVGGGITSQSVAASEWEETINKSKTMVDVINQV